MGRIALVVPNNLWVCPYVSNYSRILEKNGAEYEIISWNRANKEEEGIQFNLVEKSRNLFGVLWSYFKFARFVKNTLRSGAFDKVVVFSPQLAIFMAAFLKKHYPGRYIVDYRDLSIEQKKPFWNLFKKVLKNSFANVVSSPGFINYLPKGFDYVVSHNFKLDGNGGANERSNGFDGKSIQVLTIGAIREDCNREVMDALGDTEGLTLKFVGKGIAAQSLEEYVQSKGYNNVEFTGYYDKKDEPAIIEGCTLINIVYPLIPSHISALSNRFYNSLIYGRPMIVTKGTIQGDYAERYGVGLVIKTCEHLTEMIHKYLEELDYSQYCERCDKLLKSFIVDNQRFEAVVKQFITT